MDYYKNDPNLADIFLDIEAPPSQPRFGSFRDINLFPEFEDDRRLVREYFELDTLYERSANRLQRDSAQAAVLNKSKGFQTRSVFPDQNYKLSLEELPVNSASYTIQSPVKLVKQPPVPRHRPVIRVTVIPTNKRRKHRERSKNKKLQTTVSNKETCIRAANVFLVIEKEPSKVYGVKSSESRLTEEQESSGKNENVAIDNNLKRLLESLDMDGKKKKKGKKDKIENDVETFSLLDVFESSDSPKLSLLKECMCPGENANVNTRRSRVRITGKIGRTEDDRYVLKCNATIDGKPVESGAVEMARYSQSQSQSPQRSPPRRSQEPDNIHQHNKCPGDGLCHKDWHTNMASKEAFAQANITFEEPHVVTCPAFTSPCPAFMQSCPAYSKPSPVQRSEGTQCTPTSFNAVCISNIDKLKIVSSTKDEYMQCNCIPEITPTNIGMGSEINKSINSPLVIISVYPKSAEKLPEDKGIDPEQPGPPTGKTPKQKGGKKGKKKEGGARSRSASPVKTPSKPEKAPKAKKEKVGIDIKTAKGKKGGKKEKGIKGATKEKSRSPSPDKQSLQSGQRSPQIGRAGVNGGRCTECCMGCTGATGQMHKAEQTRSRQQTKRMMNWVSAKEEESNVAININGENEFYDVVFKQGGMSTDVCVRKTKVKSKTPARFDVEETLSDSLENFLLLSEGRKKRNRSFSQTFLHQNDLPITDSGVNGINDVNEGNEPAPLKVRDSIELSHRREEKASVSSVKFSNSSSSSSAKIQFEIAAETSLKHFQGDNCDVGNPVQRDKEIRELLGVEKPRPSRLSQIPRIFYNDNPHNTSRTLQQNNGNHMNSKKINRADESIASFMQHITPKTTGQGDNRPNADSKQTQKPSALYNKTDLAPPSNNEYCTNTSNVQYVVILDSVIDVQKATTSFSSDPNRKTVFKPIPELSMVKEDSSGSMTAKSFASYNSQQINTCGFGWPGWPTPTAVNHRQHFQHVSGKPFKYKWEPASGKSGNRRRRRSGPHLPSTVIQHERPVNKIEQDSSKQLFPQHIFSLHATCDTKFQFRPTFQKTENFVPIKKDCTLTQPLKTKSNQDRSRVLSTNQRKENFEKVTLLQENEKLKRSADIFSKQLRMTSCKYCTSTQRDDITVKQLKQQVRHTPKISLQLYQLPKNKPFTLTLKQYARMKRVIDEATPNKNCCIIKRTGVTFGEVRLKQIAIKKPPLACKGNQNIRCNCEKTIQFPYNIIAPKKTNRLGEGDATLPAKRETKSKPIDTIPIPENKVSERCVPPKLVSSTDMHREIVKNKHVSYSSVDVRHAERKPSRVNKILSTTSIHTVFRGGRNIRSPNLGTSAYSLPSDYTSANTKLQMEAQDKGDKGRKPFLRRLMSCLVMRSKVEAEKYNNNKHKEPVSLSNSTDWYHVSTSLGAVDISSSLYDTSASFYSNHSIRPIDSKMKNGFLRSVRVLLANRHANAHARAKPDTYL